MSLLWQLCCSAHSALKAPLRYQKVLLVMQYWSSHHAPGMEDVNPTGIICGPTSDLLPECTDQRLQTLMRDLNIVLLQDTVRCTELMRGETT
jgi:hypothetical protein